MQPTGLVKLTVATPSRRIDLALPEQAAIAEILPILLGRAGEGLADDGVVNGGWLLRRADGSVLELERTLASHRVRNGEILHLTARQTDWPELEYDDLVDAIATGSGRTGRVWWSPQHTRQTGVAAGGIGMLLGLVVVLRAGPPWTSPGLWALGVSALLLVAGVVMARAVSDAGVGAVLGAIALPYAFTGGGLLLGGNEPVTRLSAAHLIAAGAMLVLVALFGYIGVIAAPVLFTAATTFGLLGVLGGWLTTSDRFELHEAAAVVGGGVLALSSAFNSLALRLGRVPMPALPQSTADLVRDDVRPPVALVHAAVARADALLTGMLAGSCLAVMCCQVALIRSGSRAAVVLVAVLALGFLLRARLHPILRQRVPLLIVGLFGIGCLFVGPAMADRSALLVRTGPLMLAVAAAAIVIGISHSRRTPNPYLGRFAEYSEVLVMVAIVPVACTVLGLFGYIRGLGG